MTPRRDGEALKLDEPSAQPDEPSTRADELHRLSRRLHRYSRRVTEAERDEFLRLFGHRPAEQGEATRWLQPWRRDTKMTPPEIEELPVYDEVFQKLVKAMPIEKRLAGPAPAQVLGAFAPEQRLAGLAPATRILALPQTAPTFGFVQEPASRSTGRGGSTFFAAMRGRGPADRQRHFAGKSTGREGAIRALGSGARRAREPRPPCILRRATNS